MTSSVPLARTSSRSGYQFRPLDLTGKLILIQRQTSRQTPGSNVPPAQKSPGHTGRPSVRTVSSTFTNMGDTRCARARRVSPSSRQPQRCVVCLVLNSDRIFGLASSRFMETFRLQFDLVGSSNSSRADSASSLLFAKHSRSRGDPHPRLLRCSERRDSHQILFGFIGFARGSVFRVDRGRGFSGE